MITTENGLKVGVVAEDDGKAIAIAKLKESLGGKYTIKEVDKNTFYKELSDKDISIIRQLADWQFEQLNNDHESSVIVSIEHEESCTAVCDPWIDDSARFPLSNEEAKKMWGEDLYKEFILEAEAYICRTLFLMSKLGYIKS